jgi:predicted enzyme related to lactoylglutathione lyase
MQSEPPAQPARTREPAASATRELPYVRFASASVLAADPAKSIAWYQSVLGLEALDSVSFRLDDGSSLRLMPGGVAAAAPKPAATQSIVLGLRVPAMQAAISALEGRGVEFITSLDRYQEDSWIYFADPDQNRLELVHDGPERSGAPFEAIGWTGVHVEHFDEAVAWYRDVLGLGLSNLMASFAHFRLANHALFEVFGGGVAQVGTKQAALQPVVIDFGVRDLDRTVDVLAERGARLHEVPLARESPTGRRFEVIDPEGNRLGLSQVE